MFNPFFTTKPAGEGTGLGLSITHDIFVKQHSVLTEVDSQPGSAGEPGKMTGCGGMKLPKQYALVVSDIDDLIADCGNILTTMVG